MNVEIITLGCKVNQYESQAMLGKLEEAGYTRAPAAEADVVVVNSCTVTAQSDSKVRQTLRRVRHQNPRAVLVLTGCMPQAFPEKAASLSEADIVLGNTERRRLPQVLERYFRDRQRLVEIKEHPAGEVFEPLQVADFHDRTRAFVKIEDGCNRFCSYCIIPYARGRVRSKPLEELREEIARLSQNGYREVVLTGINLSAYGQELGLHLCDGVEAACAVPGIARVRLGSLEPEQLEPAVIARLAKQEKLCPQFHLSLQSGCDATLRRMNRHYTCGEYARIVENLRHAFENAAITTDVMVGFPGETPEEFAASLAFVKHIGFAKVHVFPYSRRPGTPAARAPMQVTGSEKTARSREMIRAACESRLAFHQAQVGRVEEVLFEQRSRQGLFEGYTRNYTPVLVKTEENLHGLLRQVRLTHGDENACQGVLLTEEK